MDVDDVLSRVKIEDYIGQYVELEDRRGEWFGRCPFHEDLTPSFSVTPDNGLYWCFGCHEGGNVITFVEKYHKLSFCDAMKHLCTYSGISEDYVDKRLNATKVIRRFKNKSRKSKDATYKILDDKIMNRYENDTERLSIWENEGICKESLHKYQVKYDPFSNRIVFPIRTVNGGIMNICGRTLDPEWKENKIRKYTYFYDMGLLDTIYGFWENKEAILSSKEIILFEGSKSVMMCDTWGIHNTGAVLTSHLNPEQRKILMKLGIKVVFALDSDVDISTDEEIKKLCRFVSVENVLNWNNLLQPKMAPVDAGKDVWNILYERRKRIN